MYRYRNEPPIYFTSKQLQIKKPNLWAWSLENDIINILDTLYFHYTKKQIRTIRRTIQTSPNDSHYNFKQAYKNTASHLLLLFTLFSRMKGTLCPIPYFCSKLLKKNSFYLEILGIYPKMLLHIW